MSTKLFDIEKQLTKFLSSAEDSGLLRETNGISGISIIEAHVQKRRLVTDISSGTVFPHMHADENVNCINIVNVSVAEKNRRKGLFKDFLKLLEEFDYSQYCYECSPFYIRIDKVMNPVLDEFLPKNGYTRTKTENETHYSYHKIVMNMNAAWDEYTEQSTAEYMFM